MQKIYYDKERNFTIVDVSGEKSVELIKEEFGDVEYEMEEFDPLTEKFDTTSGKIIVSKID